MRQEQIQHGSGHGGADVRPVLFDVAAMRAAAQAARDNDNSEEGDEDV